MILQKLEHFLKVTPLNTRVRYRISLLLNTTLLFAVALSAHTALADSTSPGKVIAGWVEKISLSTPGQSTGTSKTDPEITVKAKLDTGAETSSIHAEDIKVFKRDNKYWVKFTLVLTDINEKTHHITMEKPRQHRVKIKNRDGDHDRRSIVELEMCFDGRTHTTLFSLANRSEFLYPVLLGRRFLEGVAVIDSQATFLTLAHCG